MQRLFITIFSVILGICIILFITKDVTNLTSSIVSRGLNASNTSYP